MAHGISGSQAYWSDPIGGAVNYKKSEASQFERLGFPGEYHSPILYTAGQLDLTGSNYGYGAFIVQAEGSATLHFAGGTSSLASDFTEKETYDISVSKITGGSSAKILLLKRSS